MKKRCDGCSEIPVTETEKIDPTLAETETMVIFEREII